MKLAVLVSLLLSTCCMSAGQQLYKEWRRLGKPVRGHELEIVFAIKQTNPGWLEEKLRAVSYPDSPEYGNYMNFDEIAEYVHGRPESVQALLDALASVGVGWERIDFTLGNDFAMVKMPVEAAESLFTADFYEFQHQDQKDWKIVKSLDYTLPSILEGHLDFVFGVKEFPTPNLVSPEKSHDRSDIGVTPDTIATDYNTSGYVSKSPHNSQAIAGFLKQYFDPSDLKSFQQKFNLPVRAIEKVVGKNDASDPGVEAVLDVEYITATGRNVSTWFVSISTYANHGQEDFLSWIVGQVNTTDSPWVHSASYGDVESSIDLDFIHRVDDEFAKFGVSGRTVLFASGDSGTDCKIFARTYQPSWPASSPHITSVGGTVSLKEVWNRGGGGFSNVFPTPDYQKSIVEAYLKSGQTPSTRDFNTSGRAYPDVSAFSTGYEVVISGIPLPVSGTSCSSPTFAGLVASLNDIRLLNGKKTLGFLNPLLYQTLEGKGFFDITEGSNGGTILCSGFKAIEGWDPASGWGSPNFGVLKGLI